MADTHVVGLTEVYDMLKDMPEELFKQTKKEVARSVFNVQKAIITPMKTGVDGLQSRTGNLARSIKFSVTGTTIDTLEGHVFTRSIYAPIHEKGGTVNAKNAYTSLEGGPYLNIPSRDNKTAAGVTRLSARMVFEQGGYIVPISAPRARYAVMLNGTPMYWLVKSVNIKARLGMVEASTDEVPTLLSNLSQVLLEGL